MILDKYVCSISNIDFEKLKNAQESKKMLKTEGKCSKTKENA